MKSSIENAKLCTVKMNLCFKWSRRTVPALGMNVKLGKSVINLVIFENILLKPILKLGPYHRYNETHIESCRLDPCLDRFVDRLIFEK